MTTEQQDIAENQGYDDMVGLLQRIVRDAEPPHTYMDTGPRVCDVPATLLKEAQDLLFRIAPGVVQHYRAF